MYSLYRIIMCLIFPLPVNGTWNVWTKWGGCSVSCATGTKARNRTCLGPFYGGETCVGDVKSQSDCFLRHCPSRLILSLCAFSLARLCSSSFQTDAATFSDVLRFSAIRVTAQHEILCNKQDISLR